VINLCNIIQEM